MPPETRRVPLRTVALQWARLGCIGFGGPPTHILLLRRLCVEENGWLPADEFEDAIAAVNLLPGPASTQLAIYCAWRVAGVPGAVLGAVGFIVPGLVLILGLAALFLQHHPPRAVAGAAAGAAGIVAAVAAQAAARLAPSSWKRVGPQTAPRVRCPAYAVAGAAAAVLVGRFLVLVLLGCGGLEVLARRRVARRRDDPPRGLGMFALVGPVAATGGIGALVWVAVQVGALAYGGGFVIVPLMQHQVVDVYHFMTGTQFLDAVALGQVTPGPVVQTVAAVGYAAAGVGGGLLAAAVAFAPSLTFVVVGAPRFDRLRGNSAVQSFLTGAGPAAIGAIAGSCVSLGLAIAHLWQLGLLAAGVVWLLALRRGVVVAVVGAGVAGAILATVFPSLRVGG